MCLISFSRLLALPLLGIITIPLIISAWVTISFALLALLTRLAVVYLEIGFALIVNYFVIPTSSTSSLLTFTASEPTTPAHSTSRRNSSYGPVQSRRNSDSLPPWGGAAGFQDERVARKRSFYARSTAEAHSFPATTPLPGFPFSGDERRDFEGVGGWRSYPGSSMPAKQRDTHGVHEDSPSPPSLVSAHTVSAEGGTDADVDADERAWLSLNHRLELPSQLITLGSSSNPATTVNSPNQIDGLNTRTGSSHFQALASSASPQRHQNQPEGRRHHQRSITTSSLTTSDRRSGSGLFIALSTRPDHTAVFPGTSSRSLSPAISRAAAVPFMTPQPHSKSFWQPSPQSRTQPSSYNDSVITTTSVGGRDSGSGGYFALRRQGPSAANPNQSAVRSPSPTAFVTLGGTTTLSAENREASSRHLARFMAHYPTSVRQRRKSFSGAHSKNVFSPERTG